MEGHTCRHHCPKKKNMHVMICAEDEDVVEIGEQGTNELDKLNT